MAQYHREVSSKCVLLELSIKFGRKLYLGLVSVAKSGKNAVKLPSNTATPQFGQHNMKENGSKSQGSQFKVCFIRIKHQIWTEIISWVSFKGEIWKKKELKLQSNTFTPHFGQHNLKKMAQNHRKVISKCASLELSIKFRRKLFLGLVLRAKS